MRNKKIRKHAQSNESSEVLDINSLSLGFKSEKLRRPSPTVPEKATPEALELVNKLRNLVSAEDQITAPQEYAKLLQDLEERCHLDGEEWEISKKINPSTRYDSAKAKRSNDLKMPQFEHLTSTLTLIKVQQENELSQKTCIKDVDFATESANLSRLRTLGKVTGRKLTYTAEKAKAGLVLLR